MNVNIMSMYCEHFGDRWAKKYERAKSNMAEWKNLSGEKYILMEIVVNRFRDYARIRDKIESLLALEQEIDMALVRARTFCEDNVIQAIKEVRDIALAMNRLEEIGTAINVGYLNEIFAKVMSAVEQNVSNPGEILRVGEQVSREVLVIEQVASGTRLTPERLELEVQSMHDSVPDNSEYEEANILEHTNGQVA